MGSCYSCGKRLPEQWPAGVCMACLQGQGSWEEPEAAERSASVADLPESPDFNSRYRFEETLQEGGWSAPGIFRVFDHQLGRQIYLHRWGGKEVSRFAAGRRFVREAKLLARLSHPGLMPVIDLGIDPGSLVFLTTPVWLGRSLTEVVRQMQEGAWKPPEVGFWWIGVLVKAGMALDYLHDQGWVHAHFHPSHLFLGDGMEVLVGGLGSARPLTQHRQPPNEGAEFEEIDPASDQPNQLPFFAPEMLSNSGGKIGPWTDVYSLGAILYWSSLGRYPLADESGRLPNLATQRRKALAGEFASGFEPSACRPTAIGRLCERAMSLDPGRRHATMRELVAELESVAWTTTTEVRPRRVGWLNWFHPRS